MTWVRRDDQASIHRKVAPLDDATYRLWSEAIEWSSRNLTDGVIRAAEISVVSNRGSKPRAAKLVDRVLWHTAGTECPSPKCPPSGPDGWVIHDYFDYNPSREKVRAEQTAKQERQRRWLEGKKGVSRDASQGVSRDASQGGSRDESKDDAPSPPRPAPKGGGDYVPQRTTAADGGVAASAVRDPNPRDEIQCPTCGNAMGSAYHRGACTRSTKGAA